MIGWVGWGWNRWGNTHTTIGVEFRGLSNNHVISGVEYLNTYCGFSKSRQARTIGYLEVRCEVEEVGDGNTRVLGLEGLVRIGCRGIYRT